MKKEKGITLIALIITIIVLLILATISIATLTGDNRILSKASTAEEETTEQTAKEKLQLVIYDAKIRKVTDSKYNKDEYLNKLILESIEGSQIKEDIAIVDGYAFELNRNVPEIGKYLGKENELIFPELTVTDISLESCKLTAKVEGISNIVKYEFYVDDILKDVQETNQETATYVETETIKSNLKCKVVIWDSDGNHYDKTIIGINELHYWEKYANRIAYTEYRVLEKPTTTIRVTNGHCEWLLLSTSYLVNQSNGVVYVPQEWWQRYSNESTWIRKIF